jgi:serine O-acetyltransferase
MHRIVIINYRIGNFFYRVRIPIIPQLINYFNRIIFGVWIPCSAKIGKKFILGYGGLGVVIHNRVVIGNNCHIDQQVTIGGTSKKDKVPILGNNVYVGAGAKIIGPIKIGDNVVVGANAVVTKDIPSGSLVVGIPAKIIKSNVKKADYV